MGPDRPASEAPRSTGALRARLLSRSPQVGAAGADGAGAAGARSRRGASAAHGGSAQSADGRSGSRPAAGAPTVPTAWMTGGAAMSPGEPPAQALAAEDVVTAVRRAFAQADSGLAWRPGLARFRSHVDHARAGRPVEPLDVGGVAFGDDPAAAFERGGELARLRRPLGGQQGEPAHLLDSGQVLVGAANPGGDLGQHLRVRGEFGQVAGPDAVLLRPYRRCLAV